MRVVRFDLTAVEMKGWQDVVLFGINPTGCSNVTPGAACAHTHEPMGLRQTSATSLQGHHPFVRVI